VLRTIPGEEAAPPVAGSKCPLLKL
jgi:hypothetical protein